MQCFLPASLYIPVARKPQSLCVFRFVLLYLHLFVSLNEDAVLLVLLGWRYGCNNRSDTLLIVMQGLCGIRRLGVQGDSVLCLFGTNRFIFYNYQLLILFFIVQC